MNTSHFDAAVKAWSAGIAETPCPFGPEQNDAYAWEVAANAAQDAGATSDEATAIADYINENGVS